MRESVLERPKKLGGGGGRKKMRERGIDRGKGGDQTNLVFVCLIGNIMNEVHREDGEYMFLKLGFFSPLADLSFCWLVGWFSLSTLPPGHLWGRERFVTVLVFL